jgi:opacity protein-like surface antigen
MRTTLLASVLLVVVLILGGSMACAQEAQHPPRFQVSSSDLAVTYNAESSQVTPGGGNFWLQGGSIDVAFTFYRGLGLAANVTGDHASRIAHGVGLNELAFMAGPRYTFRLGSKNKSRLFIESLAGAMGGYDSAFPKPTGLDDRASSFTYQVGGGLDIAISKHLALRAFEADYVRTYLPNNGTDTQSHLRLAFGVTYHTQSH